MQSNAPTVRGRLESGASAKQFQFCTESATILLRQSQIRLINLSHPLMLMKHLTFIVPLLTALALAGCKPKSKASDSQSSPPQAGTGAPTSETANPTAADPRKSVITERVRKVVAKQSEVPLEKVKLTSTWKELGQDQYLAEMVLALEEEFRVEIPDDQAAAMKTVGDAIAYLTKHGK